MQEARLLQGLQLSLQLLEHRAVLQQLLLQMLLLLLQWGPKVGGAFSDPAPKTNPGPAS